ncbi:hypothetical protein GpSGHVEth151 [Glossina pallidipes salivary gland hypertrophy virus]|uniref:Uncharacterized protein n=1 Tax=Glossina hytrovirus (isolate Glossina pallidipes/Ethiopia/Seibersdorf/-) TaxID=379529 RepID=A0A0Y0M3M0_GHVS|nr:hypothetical protein GpSGHVEth151 [Glossina pallidipes salivary gland hypertrophy virus]
MSSSRETYNIEREQINREADKNNKYNEFKQLFGFFPNERHRADQHVMGKSYKFIPKSNNNNNNNNNN